MVENTCDMCGTVVNADDEAGLVAAVRTHMGDAHHFQLTDTQVRNYFEATTRLTGGTERLGAIGAVEVRPVGPDLVDEIVAFFDHDAFADNPGWGSCYCVSHHLGAEDPSWTQRTSAQNRESLRANIAIGKTTGVVALVDGKVAGWCNASLRSTFPDHLEGDDEGVGVVMCFVIAPPFRQHGLATKLLDGACAAFAAKGVRLVEGYPSRETGGWAGGAYHGPLELYTATGFQIASEDGNVLTVRKTLA